MLSECGTGGRKEGDRESFRRPEAGLGDQSPRTREVEGKGGHNFEANLDYTNRDQRESKVGGASREGILETYWGDK